MVELNNFCCSSNSSEIGKCRRWAIYIICLLEAVIFGGVIFGFAQLTFVLKNEGVFSQLCSSHENSSITEQVTIFCFIVF